MTLDREGVLVRASLDLPGEAVLAREHGAEGIGLFRTEFLVVGRQAVPDEEEQYRAYRSVAEAFPARAVLLRTFDLGGDKFPLFLRMPGEDNPFLGRRGVRMCRDEPQLFLTQMRAILRAAVHGDLRIMVPLVNTVRELNEVKELLKEAANQLTREGRPFKRAVGIGAMIETPAAALNAGRLARHSDFLSIGTTIWFSTRWPWTAPTRAWPTSSTPITPPWSASWISWPRAGREAGVEVSVCGEMPARPQGAVLLLGLGIRADDRRMAVAA